MVVAREGNIGSVNSAGPLLWAGNRPVALNHSRSVMPRTSGVPNLLPRVRDWQPPDGGAAFTRAEAMRICQLLVGLMFGF
jgi:hypothetical protein